MLDIAMGMHHIAGLGLIHRVSAYKMQCHVHNTEHAVIGVNHKACGSKPEVH